MRGIRDNASLKDEPARDADIAAASDAKPSKSRFRVGSYELSSSASRRGIVGLFRPAPPKLRKRLSLTAGSRVAVLGEETPEVTALLRTLREDGQCRVDHHRRLTDFTRPLQRYHYCIFSRISTATDAGSCGKALGVRGINASSFANLGPDEFIIWPAPNGVLLFRHHPPGDPPTG